MQHLLERAWYGPRRYTRWLAPLAWLFGVVTRWRRKRYLADASLRYRAPVPVIVVGNVAVGGTGKTPLIAELAVDLAQRGYRPGILSRGYGGRAERYPLLVDPAESSPLQTGDEPLLLARRTGCPVAVAPNRRLAAELLLEQHCDLILSDDGLQHYALERDLEIAVVDGVRGLGNGQLLPAGPLREPPARLDEVDFVVVNGAVGQLRPGAVAMVLAPTRLVPLAGGAACEPSMWALGPQVHAVAGIGNPARFFDSLRQLGFAPIEHAFPDHHAFEPADLCFDDGLPVIMTEKDAVKCLGFAQAGHWFLEVQARLPDTFLEALAARLHALNPARNTP